MSTTGIVDADVHTIIPVGQATDRLSDRWRRYLEDYGFRGLQSNAYFLRPRPLASRSDSWPPDGPPGSDPEFVTHQLLDEWSIDYAIIDPMQAITYPAQMPDFAAALSTALNDWTAELWLERDERFRASIVVPVEDPDGTVAEIARVASDERFVQVGIVCRTRELLGDRKYWSLYEAATAHDLPVAIHVGGQGNNMTTGCGFPSYYVEDHIAFAFAIKSQLISLVFQGVFERFPTLKVVLQEGGIGWLPGQMWAMDHAWRLHRDELQHLTKPPSEYIREHIWCTTQPIEEPGQPEDFDTLLRHLRMGDRLLFATDYPHWDFDSPKHALPRSINGETRSKVMAGNACDLYGLSL